MTPTDKLVICLDRQQWQSLLQVLSDGPFRVVAPLIQAIQDQAAQQDSNPAEKDN